MSSPYVGEIRMFGGNFAPAGWMFCAGQQLAISEHEVLFQLIGTTYGGDGETVFNLPDLRGRLPVHMGSVSGGPTYAVGQMGGVEEVALTTAQLPSHSHAVRSGGAADRLTPAGATFARGAGRAYTAPADAPMSSEALGASVGGEPHDNMQPYLGVNFIISLHGIFPSQT